MRHPEVDRCLETLTFEVDIRIRTYNSGVDLEVKNNDLKSTEVDDITIRILALSYNVMGSYFETTRLQIARYTTNCRIGKIIKSILAATKISFCPYKNTHTFSMYPNILNIELSFVFLLIHTILEYTFVRRNSITNSLAICYGLYRKMKAALLIKGNCFQI
jgi:hypothetical protein